MNYASHSPDNFQRDIHILSTDGPSSLMPAFTWHGFQYVELWVDNFTGFQPSQDMLTAVAVNTNVEQMASVSFEDDDAGMARRCPTPDNVTACNSNPLTQGDGHLLDRIFAITVRTQLNNLANNLPTDCPTREKHGWLGDAQVTGQEAMSTFDTQAIHRQYLLTIRDAQTASGDVPPAVPDQSTSFGQRVTPQSRAEGVVLPSPRAGGSVTTDISWSAAFPLIANWLYQHYGDEQTVAEMYDAIKRYVDNLIDFAKNEPGDLADFFKYGDW